MIQLLCFLLQLKCARLTDVCPDSDRFFPNYSHSRDVSWWLALSPCMLSWAHVRCCSGNSLAAPFRRCLLSRSLTSAETSHHWHRNSGSAHTDVGANLVSWGKKWESAACLWQSFLLLFLLDAGAGGSSWGEGGCSCLGVLGSLKWVLGVYRLSDWKHPLGLSCSVSSSTRENAGGPVLEIREKLRAEERLNSLSFLNKHL